MIPQVSDIHTHRVDAGPDAVINLLPGQEELMRPGWLYSVGVHPWHAAGADLEELERMAALEQVVMIGECGIDRVRSDVDEATQTELLRCHIDLSERLCKPLLLHVVRAIDPVLALRRELKPQQPWILHGFRGGPEQARQLVNAGLYLSIGPKHHPEIEKSVPEERLLHETD